MIRATGRELDFVARNFGLRRRWLEPDWLLRRRIVRSVVAPVVERALGVSWWRWQWLRFARRMGLR